MRYFLGIDVAKEKLDCLWLRDTESLKIKTKVFPNQPKGFSDLKAWLKKNVTDELSEIHVTLEPTGVYHEPLAYALLEMGVNISIVNPAKVREFSNSLGSKNKTDKKDSMMLARYGVMAKPRLWQPEPTEIRELKALLARLSALQADLQRELNRMEKAQISQASQAVIESIDMMIQGLRKEVARVEKQINDHIDQNPDLKRDREFLKSIPAVANVVSREMLVLLRSRDFEYAGQASAFIGLVPRLWESGTMKGRTTLSKNGSSRIRAMLYMAAVVAIRHNPDIKRQYERLLSAGKTKMQAIGAAMRKLVQICYGVLKHQSEYRPQVA